MSSVGLGQMVNIKTGIKLGDKEIDILTQSINALQVNRKETNCVRLEKAQGLGAREG